MTASPSELVVMLYDGCIRFLKRAAMAIDEKDMQVANDSLIRSQQIISELVMSLDFNYDLSNELMSIYEFCLHTITDINVTKDKTNIEPLVDILADLREAWVEVARQTRGSTTLTED